jgi:hypothetical protein
VRLVEKNYLFPSHFKRLFETRGQEVPSLQIGFFQNTGRLQAKAYYRQPAAKDASVHDTEDAETTGFRDAGSLPD